MNNETKQVATMPTDHVWNAKNLSGTKELIDQSHAVVFADGSIREAVTVRWWMARSRSASVVYCSIWAQGRGVEACGYGTAGGGGYHKESAAFGAACDSAGIKLALDVDGRGMPAVDKALHAIAEAIYPDADAVKVL